MKNKLTTNTGGFDSDIEILNCPVIYAFFLVLVIFAAGVVYYIMTAKITEIVEVSGWITSLEIISEVDSGSEDGSESIFFVEYSDSAKVGEPLPTLGSSTPLVTVGYIQSDSGQSLEVINFDGARPLATASLDGQVLRYNFLIPSNLKMSLIVGTEINFEMYSVETGNQALYSGVISYISIYPIKIEERSNISTANSNNYFHLIIESKNNIDQDVLQVIFEFEQIISARIQLQEKKIIDSILLRFIN